MSSVKTEMAIGLAQIAPASIMVAPRRSPSRMGFGGRGAADGI
jgi:hypothetical protein